MTIPANTKFRAIGGASVLALTAGLAGPAFAQSAPAPLAAAPAAPTTPTQPVPVVQCVEDTPDNFVCAPGTDPDGVGEDPTPDDPADPITITIQDGAFVTGSTGFSSGASVTGDSGTVVTNAGSIVGGANGAVILNSDATLDNSGFISSDFAIAIRLGDDVDVTNSGTIYGNSSVGLIAGRDGNVLVNSGLMQNDAGSVLFTTGDGLPTVTSVDNQVTGSMFTTANDSTVIDIQERGVVNNDGLMQSFGDGSGVISIAIAGTVTNGGNIAANGDNLTAITVGDSGSVTNDGLIQTTGAAAAGILTGENGTVVNTGEISVADSDFNGAVQVGDGSTVTNDGTISVGGDTDVGVLTGSDTTVTNNGLIEATGTDITVGILDSDFSSDSNVVVNNSATGIIRSAGDGFNASGVALGVLTGAATDNVVNNDGLIELTGDGMAGVWLGNGGVINNTGTIQATGDGVNAVMFNDVGTLNNSGTVATTGAGSVAIVADTAVSIFNADTGVISSAQTNAVQLVSPDAVLENFGLISSDTDAAVTSNAESHEVFNYGTITGGAGTAVDLGAGFDTFYALNGGDVNGTVDGGADGDTLFVLVTDENTATFNLSDIGTTYVNFERFGLGTQNFDPNDTTVSTAGTGRLILSGQTDQALAIFNSAFVTGELNGLTFLQALENPNDGTVAEQTLIISANGVIDVAINDAIRVVSDGFTINNVGLIRSNSDEAIEAEGINDLFVGNSGLIIADTNGDMAIEANDNLTVDNRGRIESVTSTAIEATGTGLDVLNLATGEIVAAADDAIVGVDGVLIENAGLISGGENDAIELNDGTITNSGTIISTSSAMGVLDAGIAFAGGAEASTVTNEAGGVIEGDVAIISDVGNTGDQTVANFGTLTGRIGEAVVLGAGNDEFQHWTGAVTDGNVRLGGDDDTFILEGSMSSILGTVSGDGGDNTAILGGVFDGDNLVNFQNISLGQLFDLRVSGDRMVTGDTSVDGNVTFALGVDTLMVDGDLVFADGSVITILTPLDEALLGQTVSVIEETGAFADNGTTINIIDDDLLIEYTPIIGSLQVQVGTANPLATSGDANIVAISGAVNNAINGGTLSAANFAAFNALPDAAAYQAALIDALPSLSEAAGREIFETSSAASDALDRHLAAEGTSVWGQVIVRGAEQDALSPTVNGYDSDQLIFTVGADFAATEGVRIGALASYADIDSDDDTATKSAEIESIKLGLYAAIDLFERGFLNTEIAYLTGEVETSRSGFLGSITSGFDFDGITARSTFGYDVLEDANVSLTPSIGVNAARINFDDAVEAGGFGFTVERGDAEFIELRGGIELGAQMSEGVDAFIKGTIIHDVIDSDRSFRLSSAQLPTFNARLPLREQDRFELAAGASIDVSETFAIDLSYLGDFNEDYSGHAGRAALRFSF